MHDSDKQDVGGYIGAHRRGDGQLYVGMVVKSVFGWQRVDEHGHWEDVR